MCAQSATFMQDPSTGTSRLITVYSESDHDEPRARSFCADLEDGGILFFPRTPFSFPDDEIQFLLGRKQSGGGLHKNIAYRPATSRITGLDRSDEQDVKRLRDILAGYSKRAEEFLAGFLSPYAGKWKLDFVSYRPLEEKGRPNRLRARNDLPHFDAFPTRPTNGDRILRLFTNINPSQSRVWVTSQTFEVLGPRFAVSVGVRRPPSKNPFAQALRAIGKAAHFPGTRRSAYDDFMHRCHNAMKEDARFQEECVKQRWEFPPMSTWIAFTDCVSHAVLEGQYALEQTFLVSRSAMVEPEKSPIAVLERQTGYPLASSAPYPPLNQ